MRNRITELLNIQYPIIQGGMIWCSGWKLASAVSNAGGLGLIGAGSMYPEVFKEHVKKCKEATQKPFGVNLPLLYPQIDDLIEILIDEKIKIVFTSAGNPKKYTRYLQDHGVAVVHVVSNKKFALKAQEAGVDAVVAEGFEAGGHNGFEELTTLVLLQLLKDELKIPVIAAGGIGSGYAMYAAFALGAEGVQIGSLFAASEESSAHPGFKAEIVKAHENSTHLVLKKLVPVRLLENAFYQKIKKAEEKGASADQLKILLGKARAKKGMFEGDVIEGELEIGQIAGLIDEIKPVSSIMDRLIEEFNETARRMKGLYL